jgi:hypothetical protein
VIVVAGSGEVDQVTQPAQCDLSREWHAAKAQFGLLFGDRFEMHQ